MISIQSRLDKLRPLFKQEKTGIFRRAAALWRKYHQAKNTSISLQQPKIYQHSKKPDALNQLFSSFPTASEGAAFGITPELISLLDEKQSASRKSKGVFYTPYPLANKLAKNLLNLWLKNHHYDPSFLPTPDSPKALALDKQLSHLTVCDPAAGAGGLLIPFWLELTHLRISLNSKIPKRKILLFILQHNLYGADIRPQAIRNLRLRASLTLLENGIKPPKNLLPNILPANALSGKKQSVWHERFPTVFKRGGFDIFLSNPPYMGQKNHRDFFVKLRKNPRWKDKIFPKGDLLYLFFYLGIELTKSEGLMGFITTTYFTQAAGAKQLRQKLKQTTACRLLIDFQEEHLFASAPGQHTLLSIFQITKSANIPCYYEEFNRQSQCPQNQLYQGPDLLLQTRLVVPTIQQALRKMGKCKTHLADIAHISNGLMTGCDKISAAHLLKFPLPNICKGSGVFVLSRDEKNKLHLSAEERKKLKPFYKNSDIQPYKAAQEPNRFLIDFFYPNDRETDFSKYPHLMKHLERFKPVLLARKQNNNGIDKQLAKGNYWFGSVRRKIDFETEKIVVPHRAKRNVFAYAPGPWYASSDVYFITRPQAPYSLWYLLALLNSAPYYMWLFYNGKRKGNLLELYTQPLSQLPVVSANPVVRQNLIQLAQKQYLNFSSERQKQINKIVSELFNFSKEEIKAIETFQK